MADSIDASALPQEYDDFEPSTDANVTLESADLSSVMPGEVKDFIVHFYKAVHSHDINEIAACYESHFNKLTDKYYKDSSWPEPEYIEGIVKDEDLFSTLYRELYFKHIYTKVEGGPTLDQRFDSYDNYIDLFNYVIKSEDPVALELPNTWLWSIIDEFIYQFHDFTLFRAKVQAKSDEEAGAAEDKAQLAENPQIWNVHIVLNVLHSLVNKSNINDQLEMFKQGGDPREVAGPFGARPLYQMLGYFSLVGLLRLQALLGDYRQALQVMANIELNQQGLSSRVPQCQITIYHYVGFCYLMMRRYKDAMRSFESILLYIQRVQSFYHQTATFEEMARKREHIFALLALTYTLCPARMEESVTKEMFSSNRERIEKVQAGDMEAVKELFSVGCPRFLSPVVPDTETPAPTEKTTEAFQLQVKIFMNEIKQQNMLATIRSYLKLYKSMKLEKLASFLNMPADLLRMQLHCYKHKTYQIVWSKGKPLEGERQCSQQLDFYIEGDMIHIANIVVARCYGADFLRENLKMLNVEK